MTMTDPGSSRSKILGNIRKTMNNSDKAQAGRFAAVDARLRAQRPNVIPARAGGDAKALLDLFITQAEQAGATTALINGPDDLPRAVLAYLSGTAVPPRLRVAPHAMLKNISWSKQPSLDVAFGVTTGDDEAALSMAFAGVAETGTLVLHSGPESPTTLNFLPDHHLVVLPVSVLAGTYEKAWTALRKAGNGAMPRTVNWVTGPSRSGDIDQTLLMGAHGPRSLHILILDDNKTV